MSDDNEILSKWAEIKTLVENIEHDVAKNARGVQAAGVRVRKGLRALQNSAKGLVKMTIEIEKAKKEEKA